MQPASRAVWTASASSSAVAMPVEMMSGLPVAAALRISGRCTFSNDAILYAGASRFSRKSTAVSSNGDEKHAMPRSRARSKMARVPLPGGVGLVVERVQRATGPQARRVVDGELGAGRRRA